MGLALWGFLAHAGHLVDIAPTGGNLPLAPRRHRCPISENEGRVTPRVFESRVPGLRPANAGHEVGVLESRPKYRPRKS
jgi:hypothetical protein